MYEQKRARPLTCFAPSALTQVRAPLGESLLEVAHANDVELEGACEGSLACSTCHVILEPEVYARLSEPTDDENDMLDLAFGLTETCASETRGVDGERRGL